ncbi:MAG TPA: hypothetical protein VJT81_06665 [Burkholderiales bacterium]|nr:hypothetical protein [Burkholderiales bacterium]
MSDQELPALFGGATHRNTLTGEPVKATRWTRDGDHPLVERYPIEKRAFKGLLVAGPKEKFGLAFGDWVLEDVRGRLRTLEHARFVNEYAPVGGQS